MNTALQRFLVLTKRGHKYIFLYKTEDLKELYDQFDKFCLDKDLNFTSKDKDILKEVILCGS